jgi:hypothetical protein
MFLYQSHGSKEDGDWQEATSSLFHDILSGSDVQARFNQYVDPTEPTKPTRPMLMPTLDSHQEGGAMPTTETRTRTTRKLFLLRCGAAVYLMCALILIFR